MESKWRQNVWRLGFQFQGASLLARLVTPGEVYLSDVEAPQFGARHTVEYYAPWGIWVYQGIRYPHLGFPHFPYGWEVETDRT
jgi:hypothetical protein